MRIFTRMQLVAAAAVAALTLAAATTVATPEPAWAEVTTTHYSNNTRTARAYTYDYVAGSHYDYTYLLIYQFDTGQDRRSYVNYYEYHVDYTTTPYTISYRRSFGYVPNSAVQISNGFASVDVDTSTDFTTYGYNQGWSGGHIEAEIRKDTTQPRTHQTWSMEYDWGDYRYRYHYNAMTDGATFEGTVDGDDMFDGDPQICQISRNSGGTLVQTRE